MSNLRFITSLLLTAAATTGCTDSDLPPGSLLDRDRVLGARVEVDGDPSRASPMPGEAATVRWIVEGPGDAAPRAWTLGICTGTVGGCTDQPFLVESGESVTPTLRFTAPVAEMLWIAGEIDGSKVFARVPVALANQNPSLAEATVLLAGQPWLATDVPAISVAAGEVDVTITLPAGARELAADGDRELLQLSHFTSVGTFDRQYSVIEDDAAGPSTATVAWIAPTDPVDPADDTLARFVFVVRDGRGGLDVTTRVARVVP